MDIVKPSTIAKILEKHKHWLNKDCADWYMMRANLSGANLSGADLSGTDLSGADLSGANLSKAYLFNADLYGANLFRASLIEANLARASLIKANLSGADLSGADLFGANLFGVDLSRANLFGANLFGVDLSRGNLFGANLTGTDLSEANMFRVNLSGANLSKAELSGADLSGANLLDAIDTPYIPMVCPEEGSFIGWKKANGKIVCLEIPEEAKRSSATSRKCRCDKAKVLSITYINGDSCELTEVQSDYDHSFIYRIGETVTVDDFDEDRWNECSTGIHFFMNRREAILHMTG